MNGEVQRPWGHYEILHREPGVQVKRIEIHPGMRFSLQTHARRSEYWVVIVGTGVATVGQKEIPVQKGSFVEIKTGEKHRLQNTGPGPLAIVEVQMGEYLGEDDIVRLQDDYGRCDAQ